MTLSKTTLYAILLLAALASAHGGEDHSAPASPSPSLPQALPSSIETIGPPIYVAKESQFLFGVRTHIAKTQELRGQVQVLGKIVPRSGGSVTLFPPLVGTVRAPLSGKYPLPGDPVKKGDLLAVIEGSLAVTDQVGLASNRAERDARVVIAQTKLSAAQKELARVEALVGIVSEREILAARTDVEVAKAELEGANRAAGIASSSGGANRFEIRAPLDGIVAEVGASIGGVIDPEHALFRIVDFSTLWVEAQIFEDDLLKIQGASEAIISPEGLGDSQFRATLLSLGRILNEQSRTVSALFSVDNPEGVLRLGMFARVGILAGENQTLVTVPKSAIVKQIGRNLVYVHTAPEFFEARAVELGPEDGSSVSIRNGLRDGERVVTEGISTLRVAAGGK